MLGVDYVAKCINDCDRRGGRMLVETPEKMPVAVRQTRGAQECINDCYMRYPGPFASAIVSMCKNDCIRRGRKTDELEDFSIPSIYSSANAPPINPGQYFPPFSILFKILSWV